MKLNELAFKPWSYAVRAVYKATGIRPSSHPYVSGDTFRALARHRFETNSSFAGAEVGNGDIVFVKAEELGAFMKKVLPGIRERFVLITHNSDANIDESYAGLADDPRIIRWFAQNLLFRHPKLIALPIGLENRWYHNNGIIRDFERLRSRRTPKKMRILYAFNVWTNAGERKPALESMRSTSLADGPQWTTSARYRASLAEYCFTLSPPGNGVDCHRTWEALYLGVVPIVKRSPFFEAFPELPALIVEDWREVAAWDEDFLRLSYDRLRPKIASCPYLWMDHWNREIKKWRGPQE